jgi:hypothetical protein
MTLEETARLGEAAAEAVYAASGELRLVDCAEVLEALVAEGHFAEADTAGLEKARVLLPGLLAAHPALAVLQSRTGRTLHHAPELLSRTYARILDRKGSPLLLVAEEIRANSRDYPRPVPVELFEGPPFDLTPEDLAHVLTTMAASPEYRDISFAATDTGAVYLFSTRHLERGYAVFLAQRAESLTLAP